MNPSSSSRSYSRKMATHAIQLGELGDTASPIDIRLVTTQLEQRNKHASLESNKSASQNRVPTSSSHKKSVQVGKSFKQRMS